MVKAKRNPVLLPAPLSPISPSPLETLISSSLPSPTPIVTTVLVSPPLSPTNLLSDPLGPVPLSSTTMVVGHEKDVEAMIRNGDKITVSELPILSIKEAVQSSTTSTQPSAPISDKSVKKLSYKAVVKANLQHVNPINTSVDQEEENRRFPWAARMNPSMRNLYRATTPTYMEDGTPKVLIPSHVLLQGLENQKEFVIGQFYRCSIPPGGLTHAIVNRIWGRKCKIFTRKLSEFSYLFHIPDVVTRSWVLQRGLWHVDHCLMFVAPWSTASTLSLPEISTVPVWVTLKNIPNQLYSISGISHIASGLGAPMATSKPRLDPTLMGEAKIMVEVELNKPFPQKIAAADKSGSISMVDVEYSWIPSKCGRCGHLGHKESRCLQPIPQVNDATLENLHPSSGIHGSSPSNNEVAPVITTSPGTEIDGVSMSNIEIASHSVSTPIETAIATKDVSSLFLGSKDLSSIKELSTTFDDVAPTTKISDGFLTMETTPLKIPKLSNVAPINVTSPISALPSLDDTSLQGMISEKLGTSIRDHGSISTPDSSDTDVDLVTTSSQRILRDRPVNPSLKYNENEWISASTCRRSKRSRGRRGKFD